VYKRIYIYGGPHLLLANMIGTSLLPSAESGAEAQLPKMAARPGLIQKCYLFTVFLNLTHKAATRNQNILVWTLSNFCF
jgi:hypothetical protein